MKLSERYKICKINPGHEDELQVIVTRIRFSRSIYTDRASRETLLKIPWWVFSICQELEAGGNYKCHMHNGDPLNAPTRHGPAGRPPGWEKLPPDDRTWLKSALDAAAYDGLMSVDWSDLDATLDRFERFNGLGYRKPGRTISPYLWSYTDQYVKGKFIEKKVNGKYVREYKPNLVSKQCGVVPMMKILELFK